MFAMGVKRRCATEYILKAQGKRTQVLSDYIGERSPKKISFGWLTARSQKLEAEFKKTHRLSAWGVLGSTTDGLPFLLTHPVVFRSHYLGKNPSREKSFGSACKILSIS